MRSFRRTLYKSWDGLGKWYLVELGSELKGDIRVLETFPSARPVLDVVNSAPLY